MTDTLNISRELLPCPFCGGKAHATQEHRQTRMPERVICLDCHVELDGPGAIDQWNTRTQPPEQPGRWERDAFDALRAVVAYDEMAEDNEGSLMMHYGDMMRFVRAVLSSASKEKP